MERGVIQRPVRFVNKNKCTHVCLDLPDEASLLGFGRVLTMAGTDAAFPESLELSCTVLVVVVFGRLVGWDGS